MKKIILAVLLLLPSIAFGRTASTCVGAGEAFATAMSYRMSGIDKNKIYWLLTNSGGMKSTVGPQTWGMTYHQLRTVVEQAYLAPKISKRQAAFTYGMYLCALRRLPHNRTNVPKTANEVNPYIAAQYKCMDSQGAFAEVMSYRLEGFSESRALWLLRHPGGFLLPRPFGFSTTQLHTITRESFKANEIRNNEAAQYYGAYLCEIGKLPANPTN